MNLVLNELSLKDCPYSTEDGQGLFQEFLECYTIMDRMSHQKGLVITSDFYNLNIAESYSIHNWLEDKRVEQKFKSKYRSMLNRSQYISAEDYFSSEFIPSGVICDNAVGCLFAYENKGVVLSLATQHLWRNSTIVGTYFSIENSIENSCIEVSVHNIAQIEHATAYSAAIEEGESIIIASGRDLWDNKELLYPHLVFCDSVRGQLLKDTERIHIEQIMKRLKKMEDYFATYDGNFNSQILGLNARGESQSVLNNEEFRQQRIFHTPYGDDKLFEWHIGFSGKYPGRIHFLPNPEKFNCIIGYIGKHLPTPTFRTI